MENRQRVPDVYDELQYAPLDSFAKRNDSPIPVRTVMHVLYHVVHTVYCTHSILPFTACIVPHERCRSRYNRHYTDGYRCTPPLM